MNYVVYHSGDDKYVVNAARNTGPMLYFYYQFGGGEHFDTFKLSEDDITWLLTSRDNGLVCNADTLMDFIILNNVDQDNIWFIPVNDDVPDFSISINWMKG